MAQRKTAKSDAARAKAAKSDCGRSKSKQAASKARSHGDRLDHRPAASPKKKTAPPEPATKKDAVIALLSRKNGASLDEMCEATGWQAHSVRGFLSGTIGKKLGLRLTSSTDASGTRRYAIKR